MSVRLKNLQIRLANRLSAVLALCSELVSDKELSALKDLEQVIEILADPAARMDKHMVAFAGSNAELALTHLAREERRYLLARSVFVGITRQARELTFPRVDQAFTRFSHLRQKAGCSGVMTGELREAYDTLLREIVAGRVELAMKPKKASPVIVSKRSERATNVGPTTLKGPTGQKSDRHGGYGTSRKSLRRQRQRARKAA